MSKKTKKRDKKYNPKAKYINQHQENIKDVYLGASIIPLKTKEGETSKENYAVHLDLYKANFDEFKHQFLYPNKNILAGLHTLKHKWILNYAVLCRDKKGKVYFVQQNYAIFNEAYTFNEIEHKVMELLMQAWKKANPEYRLTISYALSTQEFEHIEWNLLATVYYRDLLSHIHTQWEKENKTKFGYYEAKNFNEFFYWYTHQKEIEYNQEALISNTISFEVKTKEELYPEMKIFHPHIKLIPKEALPEKDIGMTIKTEMDLEKAIRIYRT